MNTKSRKKRGSQRATKNIFVEMGNTEILRCSDKLSVIDLASLLDLAEIVNHIRRKLI